MIRFALRCANDHSFEAWFSSSDAFDRQKREQAIACPACRVTTVEKALMVPAIAGTSRDEPVRLAAHVAERDETLAVLRKLRREMTENAEYVGDRFAAEARRIHYEESEKRGIYGEANIEDVRSLLDDGIEFHPIPVLPEDRN